MSMAMIAAASANTNKIIIAVKIRGEPDGFLPRALILALPQVKKTQQGPKIQMEKMTSSARLRSISSYSSTITVALLELMLAIPRRIEKIR